MAKTKSINSRNNDKSTTGQRRRLSRDLDVAAAESSIAWHKAEKKFRFQTDRLPKKRGSLPPIPLHQILCQPDTAGEHIVEPPPALGRIDPEHLAGLRRGLHLPQVIDFLPALHEDRRRIRKRRAGTDHLDEERPASPKADEVKGDP